MDFLKSKLKKKGCENLFYLINRFDIIDSETDKQKVKNYAYSKLIEYTALGKNGIFFVSASDALEGKFKSDKKKYQNSGMPEFEKRLAEYLTNENGELKCSAIKKEVNKIMVESETTSDVSEKTELYDEVSTDDNISDIKDDSVNENVNTGKHLRFAEQIINRYKWDSDVEKSLKSRLEKIKKKHKDKKLNLSVIGEFSVGKSTFINGLLREDLLTSNILQGTTVASTIIEHSSDYAMLVELKNNKTNRFTYNNLNDLKEGINKYAATPQFAKQVDSISVYHPSSDFLKDIRIIDTPGTNALEAWHEETTIRAIRELSDASIILIDATKILPETQKNFIHEHLEDVLGQCIFIVTKIDCVRSRERERTLEYVR